MARILIAEDNSLVRWTLATLLQSQGHDVDLAVDGQQALHLFTAHPADVVVLDVHMPGMNGLEACQQLRQGSAVPIVMLSTLDYALVRDQAQSCEANAFLLKPLEIDSLLGWVRTLCGAETQPPPSGGQPVSAPPRHPLAARQETPPSASWSQRPNSAPTQANTLTPLTADCGPPRAGVVRPEQETGCPQYFASLP